MTLTIWGRLNSHNVKKVAWFAEEIGLPYVRHDVGGKFGMSADYLALNPNALIPTIQDSDLVLWESNAILRYLAAAYGPDFWPADPALRALADRWMDWQITYGNTQRDAFWQLIRHQAHERDNDAVAKSAEACGKLLAVLETTLANQPWLSGEAFGLGDVPMGVYIHTWFTLDIARPPRPHVEQWYNRLRERPGYINQVMIPLT